MTVTAISKIASAKRALAQARTIPEVLDVRDKAAAIANYMKQIGESLEVQNHAAYIKLSAERKAGELLAGMEDLGSGKALKLRSFGIERNQSSRWQLEAKLPVEMFDELSTKATESGVEFTQSLVLREARRITKGEEEEQEEKTELGTVELIAYAREKIRELIDAFGESRLDMLQQIFEGELLAATTEAEDG